MKKNINHTTPKKFEIATKFLFISIEKVINK